MSFPKIHFDYQDMVFRNLGQQTNSFILYSNSNPILKKAKHKYWNDIVKLICGLPADKCERVTSEELKIIKQSLKENNVKI